MATQEKRGRGRPIGFDRSEVLDQAIAVFWRAGYEGASISMLTDAMQISAQSLYGAFGSKEALYREAMDQYLRTLGGFGAAALERSDAIDAVGALIRAAAHAFATNPVSPGCMVMMAPSGPAADPLVLFGRDLRAAGTRTVEQRLRAGVAAGQVRPDADCGAWARYVGSVVQGMSIQARDAMPVEHLSAAAEIAVASLEALRPKAP